MHDLTGDRDGHRLKSRRLRQEDRAQAGQLGVDPIRGRRGVVIPGEQDDGDAAIDEAFEPGSDLLDQLRRRAGVIEKIAGDDEKLALVLDRQGQQPFKGLQQIETPLPLLLAEFGKGRA